MGVERYLEPSPNGKIYVIIKAPKPLANTTRIPEAHLVSDEPAMQNGLLTLIGAKERWLEHMKEYLRALRSSIDFLPSAALEDTMQGYFEYRFYSIGVLVLFTWVE